MQRKTQMKKKKIQNADKIMKIHLTTQHIDQLVRMVKRRQLVFQSTFGIDRQAKCMQKKKSRNYFIFTNKQRYLRMNIMNLYVCYDFNSIKRKSE